MTAKKVNSMEVKKYNRNSLFKFLYKHEPISIQDISYSLKMSLPTVTQNIRELQESGLIVEMGLFESTGGRKAKAISFNNDARYAIGIDITKNHISIVAITLGGTTIKHKRIKYVFENCEEYFYGLSVYIENVIDESNIEREKILGVGIALPVILSHDNENVVYASVIDFFGGSIKSFTKFIKYPCIMCNDANAAGFAEMWNSNRVDYAVYLSLNNSVGGSIIIDKNVYFGSSHRSGEFGHMTIVPEGKICYCGQRGCADSYCSAKVLSDSTDGNIDDFFSKLKEGVPKQVSIWKQYKKHLITVINNLRMAFDCDIIVGGYVGAYLDDFVEDIRNSLAKRNTFEKDGNYMQVCRYKMEATAVGAALHHVNEFIKSV